MTAERARGRGVARYPFEGQRWLRMWALFVASLICAGVGPGSGAWVPLFAEAGVYSSLCSSGDGAGGTCEKQEVAIGGMFQVGGMVTIVGIVLCGYCFDRFGANWIGRVGAMIVCLGLLLLSLVVFGARSGYDAQTSGLLILALCITDFGSYFNSYCLYGLLYHFPEYQTAIGAISTASFQATALFPLITSMVQNWTHWSLDFIFFVWFALAVLAYFACSLLGPTIEEYDDYAQRVLGFAPRTSTASFCSMCKDGQSVLRPNWVTHLFFVVALAGMGNASGLYISLSSAYGDTVLHKGAGKVLSQQIVLCNGVLGGLVAPLFSFLADKYGNAVSLLNVLMVLFCVLAAFFVTTPTWLAQEATGIMLGMAGILTNPFLTKYTLAFASPSRLGFVLGLLLSYMAVLCMVMIGGSYTWISLLPSDSPEHLLIPMQGSLWFAAALLVAWCVRYFYAGLPATPVLLSKDEEDIAAAHGCTSFDEMARKAGLKDRDEVISMLGSSDSKALQDLAERARTKQPAPSANAFESDEESSGDRESSEDESQESGEEGRCC